MSMKLAITTAAVLAALAGPTLADNVGHARKSTARASAYAAASYGDARAAYGASYDFAAYPTDYLMNRFGDRQMQGR
jgi:hypothetical protein